MLLLAQIAAAPPTPDLRSILASPPSSDWVELTSDTGYLTGAFDARGYGSFADDGGASEQALDRFGFVAGYGRDWRQSGSRDYLVELVFEFRSGNGAIGWHDNLKLAFDTSQYFKGDIPDLEAELIESFGVELDHANGREYGIGFPKGNAVYLVRMESTTRDLSAAVHDQALKQYATAPDIAGKPVANHRGANDTPLMLGAWIIVAGIVLAIIAAVIATVVLSRRRHRGLLVSGIQMSPDGAYWWDGQRWRLVQSDPPPRPG